MGALPPAFSPPPQTPHGFLAVPGGRGTCVPHTRTSTPAPGSAAGPRSAPAGGGGRRLAAPIVLGRVAGWGRVLLAGLVSLPANLMLPTFFVEVGGCPSLGGGVASPLPVWSRCGGVSIGSVQGARGGGGGLVCV